MRHDPVVFLKSSAGLRRVGIIDVHCTADRMAASPHAASLQLDRERRLRKVLFGRRQGQGRKEERHQEQPFAKGAVLAALREQEEQLQQPGRKAEKDPEDRL